MFNRAKTIADVRREISILVKVCDGLKFTEVLTRLPGSMQSHDIDSIVQQMIADGDLSEVEYFCPATQHRAKSFLLPAGVAIRLNTKTKQS